ncbi:putative mitochondrial carrier domain protein [Helianthus annuus]|uniref:Mitochondrial carrier domain protein n=1 Tax=Helianthus annuus TaxID=4232 RepID=A0A9K3HD15_HELAN|nr:putative mitochondrial carrier domain protein [Helianthus annuus]
MDTRVLLENNEDGLFPNSGIGFLWCSRDDHFSQSGTFFASVGQMGSGGFATVNRNSPNSTKTNDNEGVEHPCLSKVVSTPESRLKKKGGLKLKIKIGDPSLRRLISGAIAGTEGWTGLFRGNMVNVIRVAPSKAIELFAYDTVKKRLTPKHGEKSKPRIPESLIAGAVAGISSTICTYPLELLKTRLTVQRGVYKNLVDAFLKIVKEEGPTELYRGLAPSLIGVVPYAAANYFAYDTLRKAYKKISKKDEINNIATLLIGSAAGAISSSATFPLEVARKHMQAGAVNGRVYDNMLHALLNILEKEGVGGLYRGLGPSCVKIVPAAGISFMCYEACKKILVEKEDDEP